VEQADEPMTWANWPLGHFWHVDVELAPISAENLPAGQPEHVEEPGEVENLPDTQNEQLVSDVAPGVALSFPASQGTQKSSEVAH
jgi:hypothetical protein